MIDKDMIQEAIIIAGGEGTRLRPITYEIPKPLVPVQGRPILTWLARWLFRYGVLRIHVIIPAKWEQAFATWRMSVSESEKIILHTEHELMGTAGFVVHHLLPTLGSGPFFVTNGDELKGLDLHALEAFHAHERLGDSAYAGTLALVEVTNPSQYGVPELVHGRIERFHEKPAHPPGNAVSAGLYLLERQAFDVVDRTSSFLMFEHDVFPLLASLSRLGGVALPGPWYDCGTMERWEKAIHEWKEI